MPYDYAALQERLRLDTADLRGREEVVIVEEIVVMDDEDDYEDSYDYSYEYSDDED